MGAAPDGDGHYTQALLDALSFAADLHRHQSRKGTEIPYVSHLMGVASIVMECGGNETQAIAGLLHDAVEDQGGEPTLRLIKDQFGAEVARIVAACSDAAPAAGEQKAPWRERKEHHLASLAGEDAQVLLVAAADKIHNGEAILNDLHTYGPTVWSRFNAAPADIAWYYTSTHDIIAKSLENPHAVGRLGRVASALRQAANSL